MTTPHAASDRSLAEVARVFLKLGATSFGGPAAHVVAMEDELVVRRAWIERRDFLDLVGVTALLPGPNSTELAMAIGQRRAGARGLVVAGVCFILPAALSVLLLAMVYVAAMNGADGGGWLSRLPDLLSGVHPVVLAVVIAAAWRLSRTALRDYRDPLLVAVAALALLAALFGIDERYLLAAGAIVGASRGAARSLTRGAGDERRGAWCAPGFPGGTAAVLSVLAPTTAAAMGLPALFASFLRIGSLLFGSGYVLFAFLQQEFIVRRALLTDAQLLDAIAIGQATPGPLFTTATFVGYLLHGGAGAAVATVGIFLPAFLLVAVHGPLVRAVHRHALLRGALDGVNATSLSLMVAAVTRGAVAGDATWLVAVGAVAALLLVRFRVPVWLLLLGGAGAGVLRGFLIG